VRSNRVVVEGIKWIQKERERKKHLSCLSTTLYLYREREKAKGQIENLCVFELVTKKPQQHSTPSSSSSSSSVKIRET